MGSPEIKLIDALAERSKAVAQGAIPKGRGLEPHRRHCCVAKTACCTTEPARTCPPALVGPSWLDVALVPGHGRTRRCQAPGACGVPLAARGRYDWRGPGPPRGLPITPVAGMPRATPRMRQHTAAAPLGQHSVALAARPSGAIQCQDM